jgi:hypothetical protein
MAPPTIPSTGESGGAQLAAEKGQRYVRIFRKAGALLGKGNIARAIAALKEGRALAEQLGDQRMARRFADDLGRAGKSNPSE